MNYGEFEEVEEAAKFGNEEIKKLKYAQDLEKFVITLADGKITPVNSSQIEIKKFNCVNCETELEKVSKDILYTGKELDKLEYRVVTETGETVDYEEYIDYIERSMEEESRKAKVKVVKKLQKILIELESSMN